MADGAGHRNRDHVDEKTQGKRRLETEEHKEGSEGEGKKGSIGRR